ncbi:MAG: hypothetical protein JXJ17_03945 [Anaerolineae bacterium]|nr:hypothetical protein [Anaerolineae bacterium]
MTETNDQQTSKRRIPIWVWIVAGVLVLAIAAVVLFLPPLSLAEQIGGSYTNLAGVAYFHPDGLSVLAVENLNNLRVQVSTIPREAFLSNLAGEQWQIAHTQIPSYLTPLSPIFSIKTRGEGQIVAEMSIPNGAEPYERLALYAWNTESRQWEFVPSQINPIRQVIQFYPSTDSLDVMAVHVEPQVPDVALVVSEGGDIPDARYGFAIVEGVKINETGMLVGQTVPASASTIMLLIENRLGGVPSYSDTALQAALSEQIAAAVGGNAGVVLDFAWGEGYSDFIAALSENLHTQGKRVEVVIRADDAFEPVLPAVSGSVDRFWAAPGDNPRLYLENGGAQETLDKVVSLVDRSQIGLMIDAGLVESTGNYGAASSLDTAVAAADGITVVEGYADPDEVVIEAGTLLPLKLDGPLTEMGLDLAMGLNYLAYYDADEQVRYLYFGSASNVRQRLEWANLYSLNAVAIKGIAHPDAPGNMINGVSAFLDNQTVDAPAPIALAWKVLDETGLEVATATGDLTLVQYVLNTSIVPGQYTVTASFNEQGREILIDALAVVVVPKQ